MKEFMIQITPHETPILKMKKVSLVIAMQYY